MKKILFAFFTLFSIHIFAQTTISYSGSGGYSLVERTDLRRYENGKYKGLTSREIRSFISPSESPNGTFTEDRWYDGSFYVQEETLRNSREVTAGIHDSIPSVFRISSDGKLTMFEDNGYPSFRSFPSFPSVPVAPGERWNASGERAVDPLYKGIFTRIPILVQYEFVGAETYKGEAVFRIRAMWQTNYGANKIDRKGDPELIKALGGHKADILVRQSTGEAILVSDAVDETFFYQDGLQVQFKGKITLFTEFPPAVQHDKILPALAKIATVKPSKNSENAQKARSTTSAKTQTAVVSQKPKTSAEPLTDDSRDVIEWDDEKSESTAKDENSADNSGKRIADSREKTPYSTNDEAQKETSDSERTSKKSQAETVSDSSTNTAAKETDEQKAQKPASRAETVAKITKAAEETDAPKNNMVVEETPAGIRLSMRDIRFKADSAEVLPSESYRLDEIAKVLKMVPDSQFLVEGHTAAVGKPQGEKTLSEQRAHKIAEELAKRGVPASSFITRGLGGTKPVASNATDAGRAQNRRVEITILE